MKFWIPWAIDALATMVLLYFFVAGLIDSSVSSRNIGLWLLIFLGLAGIMGGSLLLKSTDRPGLATALLLIPAVPGVVSLLLLVIAFISGTRWN
jgi:hypothetical protein